MKLPENKKERIKLFCLIGIFAVFILYFLVRSAAGPMLRMKAEQKEQIAKLKAEIETAQRVTDIVGKTADMNRQTVDEIIRIAETDGFILRPRLGNYLLEATEIIEAKASEAGVSILSVKAAEIAECPVPGDSSSPGTFSLYTARVGMECGMHELISFLRNIEQSNPYLCISGIDIAGRPGDPATHEVTVHVQWPIWRDTETLDSIKKLAELPGEDK